MTSTMTVAQRLEGSADQLIEYADQYGIVLDTDKAHLLLRHLAFVLDKNRSINLTAITDPDRAVIQHILDSLLLTCGLKHMSPNKNLHFLDIGCGAGYPGIPFGIATGLQGMLIDSIAKKIRVVSEIVDTLGLGKQFECRAIRAEELAREATTFEIVMARAVAASSVLIEYARPLLCDAGRLIVSKARLSNDELLDALRVAEICGLTLVSRETFELPFQSGHREILTFTVIHDSKVRLPRRTGLAVHKPL